MSSPERVQRVLSGALPDRVPVLMQNFQNTAFLAGMTLREFCLSAENMAEAQVSAWERFRYDVLDLENGTAAMAEALGCQVEYPENQPPRVVAPALRSLEELDRLRPVDPTRDGHLPELLKATTLVHKRLKGRASIVGEADQGPFSLAGLLLGMEPWLMAVVTPALQEQVQRLLEFCYAQVLRLALAQIEAGADLTMIGDSLAGPDVCSPRVYRRLAWPYERRLAEELQGRGIPLILHICGNTTAIISDMAETGAIVLEVDHKINADRCRAATAGRSVLAGNVDPSGVMALGRPEDVLEHCRIAIRTMGQQGWFTLSPGCTLPVNTPAENTAAMVEAAQRFGRYGAERLLGE